MSKTLNAFAISPEVQDWLTQFKSEMNFSDLEINWKGFETKDELQKNGDLSSFDFGLANGRSCLDLSKLVKRRTVGSHFLNYIDFVKVHNGDLWGQCLFYSVLEKILRTNIKTQDYKGSVIFLGDSPLIYPALGVLSQFGFSDFVFLQLKDNKADEPSYESAVSGLFNVKIDSVNSDDFIQSQREYSMCFVLENHYSTQTLEDMSYFHFLSSNSMVFNLAGKSNFLFNEVKALGVNVVEAQEFTQVFNKKLLIEIKKCL